MASGTTTSPICVADVEAVLGEGPVWVGRERALYWVDIKGHRIFRHADGATTVWTSPFRICSLAPRVRGGFVAGTEFGFGFVELGRDGEAIVDILDNPEPERPTNRFNDGKLDRAGRFWAGTMDDREAQATGALYRLGPDLAWARADDGYRVTNGPAFSPGGRIMYHNDSARQTVYAFDLDAGGEPSNKRVLARFGEGEGYPDGMTVDAAGCVWIAFWDGWCVRRLSPEGDRLAELKLPVQRPTSCAFGGDDFDRLYVTSARIGLDEATLAAQPQAGGLFLVEPGVRGLAEAEFAV